MDPNNPYRNPGILNERRRKYLLGDLDLDDSNERKIRGEIREKTKEALLDFEVLNRMSGGDLEQIVQLDDVWMQDNQGALIPDRSGSDEPSDGGKYRFEQLVGTTEDNLAFRNPYLEDAIIETIRFLFRLSEIENVSATSFIEDIIPEAFRRFASGSTINIDVDVKSKNEVIERAKKKYGQGERLTTEEKAVLFDSMIDD